MATLLYRKQSLEKSEVTYTYQEVMNLFPELNLEEALLLQSLVFKEAVGFLSVYTADAMILLFLRMDNHIMALENGIRLNMNLEANENEEE